MTEESYPKTLYVGNLDTSVTEELLCTLFSQMGTVKSCKIIREASNDPYAFIEYASHTSAQTALAAMNKRFFLKKEIKVNWATSPGNQPKTDTSQHYHIFVGDLSPEIETETLREAFAPFGEISNCRIVRDPQTLKSRGYAFVSFVKKAEAENAIQMMNGQWLGSRSIRTNWSTRKPPAPRDNSKGIKSGKTPGFEEIYNNTSPTNTTVYCGGFPPNTITDELIQKHFAQFGQIHDTRVFKDKGYAFIRFANKESAARAIEGTHNSEVQGHPVKCYWGKENGGDVNSNGIHNATASAIAAAAASGMMGMNGLVSPLQPMQQQQNAAAAAAAAANLAAHQHNAANSQLSQASAAAAAANAQYPYSTAYGHIGTYWIPGAYPPMQTQYMQQGYYGYPAAYATAAPQQSATAGYRMMQPNMGAWSMPTVPTVATNGAAAAAAAAAAAHASSQQPMMYATMPQFQTQ
ncbi:nucleolysin TIAR [Anopheles darlingi]|uniref:nucleolysin TIAR n=1 Tax=Anopheles darlingi TaxID=43151 RepID=UPI00210041F1|nr:nucleolysin TIAR [Anopheles darlingi]XP_049530271.1 nucleolysin TIAR [Anopheles darlingi]XP_049530272.1 nucleolysin TIAR [Anopheles darlingi]